MQSQRASFAHGTSNVVTEQRIGASGGAIRLGAALGDARSMRIEFPPGALETETTVTVALDDGRLSPVAGRAAGVAVRLSAGALKEFRAPVRIAIDYPTSSDARLVAGYAIDDDGRLHVLDLESFDGQQKRVVFLTWTPLTFTWIYVD